MFPPFLVLIVGNTWSAFAIKMASSAVVCISCCLVLNWMWYPQTTANADDS